MHQKQYDFVLAYLKTSDKAEAYRISINMPDLPDETAAEGARIMMAYRDVAQAIEDIVDNIRISVFIEMESNMPRMLTVEDKRAILAEIARGKMMAYAKGAGEKCCTCGMSEHPTIAQIIKAIQKDCRPCISRAYMMMMVQRIEENRKG